MKQPKEVGYFVSFRDGYIKRVEVEYKYGPDIPGSSANIDQLGIGTHSLTVLSPWRECSTFSTTEVINAVPIFVQLGTHYCWVDRSEED